MHILSNTCLIAMLSVLLFTQCGKEPQTEPQIESVEISSNPYLKSLECTNLQLTSLDVSDNIQLEHFRCRSNQLTSMPTLFEVCVCELPFPPEGVDIDTTASTNIYFTTACSK